MWLSVVVDDKIITKICHLWSDALSAKFDAGWFQFVVAEVNSREWSVGQVVYLTGE